MKLVMMIVCLCCCCGIVVVAAMTEMFEGETARWCDRGIRWLPRTIVVVCCSLLCVLLGLAPSILSSDDDTDGHAYTAESKHSYGIAAHLIKYIVLFEIGVAALHWLALLCIRCRRANEPQVAAHLTNFLIGVPILCGVLYWPVREDAATMLQHHWFVSWVLAPLCVLIGNMVVPVHLLPVAMAMGPAPPPNHECIMSMYGANVCCVGASYFIAMAVFQVTNYDNTRDEEEEAQEIDIGTVWSCTWPCVVLIRLGVVSALGMMMRPLREGFVRARAAGDDEIAEHTGRWCGVLCGPSVARVRIFAWFLFKYSPVICLQLYVAGWPAFIDAKTLGEEITPSFFSCLIVVGCITLGITTGWRVLLDILPRGVTDFLWVFNPTVVVSVLAALVTGWFLLVFCFAVGTEATQPPPYSAMPDAYWESVGAVHSAAFLLLLLWLFCSGEEEGREPALPSHLRVASWLMLIAAPMLLTTWGAIEASTLEDYHVFTTAVVEVGLVCVSYEVVTCLSQRRMRLRRGLGLAVLVCASLVAMAWFDDILSTSLTAWWG